MALAASTSTDDETIALAAGSHTGHILVSHTGCTVEGAGIDRTTIVLDGTYAEGTRPGAAVATFTLKNLTIDCAGLSAVTAPLDIGGGIAAMTANSVRILDHYRGTTAVGNRGAFAGYGLEIVGNGGAVNHMAGATSTLIRGMRVVGGKFAFVSTAAAGIDLSGINGRSDWWASPTYEVVTATAYGSTYVDVSSHVEADRSLYDILRYLSPVTTFDAQTSLSSSLVQKRDRVEVADGRWTQVLGFGPGNQVILDEWRAAGKWKPVATPTGTATVYRVTIGTSYGYSGNRIFIQTGGGDPTGARWRGIDDDSTTASTPTTGGGSRLDIIRNGGSNRDTDSGFLHVTETATDAIVSNCSAYGWASDVFTMRGLRSSISDCYAEMGNDMDFTFDGTNGPVTATRCHAVRAGRTGFNLTGGPSNLYSCRADYNGFINDGGSDYGVTTTSDCAGSILQIRGTGNLTGLIGGTVTEVSPGGFGSNAEKWRTRRWEEWPPW